MTILGESQTCYLAEDGDTTRPIDADSGDVENSRDRSERGKINQAKQRTENNIGPDRDDGRLSHFPDSSHILGKRQHFI